MERIQTFFASRNVKLLLILFITVVIGLVSYYVRQQQELRGRAAGDAFYVNILNANGESLNGGSTNSKLVSLQIGVPINTTIQGNIQSECTDPNDPNCNPGGGQTCESLGQVTCGDGSCAPDATQCSGGGGVCAPGQQQCPYDGQCYDAAEYNQLCQPPNPTTPPVGGACSSSDSCLFPLPGSSFCEQHGGTCSAAFGSCVCGGNPNPTPSSDPPFGFLYSYPNGTTIPLSGTLTVSAIGQALSNVLGGIQESTNRVGPTSILCSDGQPSTNCAGGQFKYTFDIPIAQAVNTAGPYHFCIVGDQGTFCDTAHTITVTATSTEGYTITTQPVHPTTTAAFEVDVVGSPPVANVLLQIHDASNNNTYPLSADTPPSLSITCSDGTPTTNGCTQYKWAFTIPAGKIATPGTYTAYFYKDNITTTFVASGNFTVMDESGGGQYAITLSPNPVIAGQQFQIFAKGPPIQNVKAAITDTNNTQVYPAGEFLTGVVLCASNNQPIPTPGASCPNNAYIYRFTIAAGNPLTAGSYKVRLRGDNIQEQFQTFTIAASGCPNGCTITKITVENVETGIGGDTLTTYSSTSHTDDYNRIKQGQPIRWNLVELPNGVNSTPRTVKVSYYTANSTTPVSQVTQQVTYTRSTLSITPNPSFGPTIPGGNPTVPPGNTLTPTRVPTLIPTSTNAPGAPTSTPVPGVPTATPGPGTPSITPGPGTPTGTAGATRIYLKLNLEGVGGATTPIRLSPEPVKVELTSAGGTWTDATGAVTFNTATRRFEGEVVFPTSAVIPTGMYKLVIKPSAYLAQTYGTVQINQGQVNEMIADPTVVIKSCDFNNDNKANQLDLGALFSDLTLKAPTTTNETDINRNGRVDVFDHNFCVQNFGKEGELIHL